MANDRDDLQILSAMMEGAITSPGEMSFAGAQRHFTLTASRIMWEKADRDAAPKAVSRIRSGLYVADVLAAKSTGISRANPTEVMELLSIAADAGPDETTDLRFSFAGGGVLCLSVECINVGLTDSGDAWETDHVPAHDRETGKP
nr:DUF2948 family protein [Sneathiella chinensis]